MMPVVHKKKFGIYHWDTFDDETILVGEADTFIEAKDIVSRRYKGRLRSDGADRVDIVDLKGNVKEKYSVC